MTRDDAELLRQFVHEGDKIAFGELVQRHLGVVYHAALRQAGDSHRAEEVAQEVFTLLAKKAPSLTGHPMLIGWLYATTRRTAWRLLRSERRRQQREHEAWVLQDDEAGTAEWERLRPALDEALDQLKPAERDALLLRYFQELPFAEIGRRFLVSEDAARMRVERALEKLRGGLVRRGITSTAGALGLLLANNAVGATPGGLAASVTTAALSQAATGGFFAALAKVVFMTKTQAAILGGALIVLTTGAVWQWEGDRVLETQVEWECLKRAELQGSVGDIERSIADGQAGGTAVVLPALTPKQEERKQWILQSSRKSLDSQYAALFRHLRLSPADLEKLKDLLAEREWELVMEHDYVRENGLRNLRRVENSRISEAVGSEINEPLRAFLGEENYAYFERYDRSSLMRNLFSRYTEELKVLAIPLSDDQMDAFADLAYEHLKDGCDRRREGGGPVISEDMMAKAAIFLSPGQIERLKAAQEEMAARLRIDSLNRAAAEQGRLKVTSKTAKYYPKCSVDRE